MRIAILILIGITNYENVFGALNRPSTFFQFLEPRNHLEACNWQCETVSAEVSIKTDWELEITTNSNLITIGYNATLKLMAFINHKLQISVALDGNTGFIGWFNITSGTSIVINIKTGLAKLVQTKEISDLLTTSSNINTHAALGIFHKIITSQTQELGTHSITDEIFDLLAITDAIYNNYNYTSISGAYFKAHKSLGDQVYTSFKAWFDLTQALIAEKTINPDFGMVGFFGPVFGQPRTLFVEILKLWVLFYNNTSGQFNGLFTLAIYRILSVSIATDESDQVFASLTFTIGAIGSFYGNLNSALSGYEGRYRLVSLGKKTLKIENVTYNLDFGKFVEDSWFANLKSPSVDVVLLYVKSTNAFAIYNRKLNVILVFSGSTGLFALWSTKTGEGIIVRYSTGAAIVIHSDSSVVQSFSADAIIHACIVIVGKIDSYKSFGYSLLDKSTFFFSTYLLSAERSGVAAANVAVSSTVRAVIIASFDAFFKEITKRNSLVGVLNVVFAASGGTNTGWSVQIQELIHSIYSSKLAGRFDSRLFAAFYNEMSLNSDIGSHRFLGKIISAVKSIADVSDGVASAISSAFKANGIIGGSLSGSVFL